MKVSTSELLELIREPPIPLSVEHQNTFYAQLEPEDSHTLIAYGSSPDGLAETLWEISIKKRKEPWKLILSVDQLNALLQRHQHDIKEDLHGRPSRSPEDISGD